MNFYSNLKKTKKTAEKIWKIFPLFLTSFFILSCASKAEKQRLYEIAVQNSKKTAIEQFVSQLPENVKISQLFLVNIEGNKNYFPVEKTGSLYGKKNEGEPLLPGGCLFFSYNIADSKEQVRSFINSINSFYSKNNNVLPFIAVDQEGGSVNRLRKITGNFPSEKYISQNFDEAKARELYENQAGQMAELGFNMNLAPVVEVETLENSGFLDTRSFGSLEKVLFYAPLEINAFENQRIATVLKHFPGNSNTDPHTGLPEIKISSERLKNELLEPFKKLLPLSSSVLMSHARITVEDDPSYCDSSIPACLSEFWVTKVLREDFGFEGLVLSDDIFMGALADNGFLSEDAAIRAIEAGVNIIMLSEKRFGSVAKILLKKASESQEFNQKIQKSVQKIIEYKIKGGLLELRQIDFDSDGKKLKVPAFKVVAADF